MSAIITWSSAYNSFDGCFLFKFGSGYNLIQCQIEISNRFATLKNLNDSEDINRAWEDINESTRNAAKESLGLYELK